WMPAPLNHAVGFFHGLIAPMLLGGRSVLMQDFAVKDAVDLINAEGATWSMCSTPFIYDIVKYLDAHPDYGAFADGAATTTGLPLSALVLGVTAAV
ncbi:hypothetical protein NE591_15715, partial [Adlercreutzia sp. DFI.6.23]|nr:hypothetical protein [Adlercreutzia sp. DFI.6.23]